MFMYFNVKLDRDMFDPTLLDEVCRELRVAFS